MTSDNDTRTALVTGGSSGLGLALVTRLDRDGWDVVTDARDADRLHASLHGTGVRAVPGDVADPSHRDDLVRAVADLGGLDLLVLSASTLGPLPMPPLERLEPEQLARVLDVNAGAPAALMVALTDHLRRRGGTVVAISSDAAVEHYETWGPYGASKAALDHLVLTFGAETGLRALSLDPGDMRTPMHADAFRGEDISDRPLPETVVPALLGLLADDRPSGRYRAGDLPRAESVEPPADLEGAVR